MGCGSMEGALSLGPGPRVPAPDPTARGSLAFGTPLDFLEPCVIHLTKGLLWPPVGLVGSPEGQARLRGCTQYVLGMQAVSERRG